MTQQPHRERYSKPHSTPYLSFAAVPQIRFSALLWATSLLLVAAPASTATELTMGRAVEVGVKPEVLNQAASLIEEAVAEDKIPGAVILVARKGKIILDQAYGHRNLQRTRPVQVDSLVVTW